MPSDLTGHLDRLVQRVEAQVFTHAAEAMAEQLRQVAADAIGGDLTLSGGGGTVIIDGEARHGQLVVTVGGAYRLVNDGRRSVVPAVAAPGSALSTPWGPRRSVRGSRTAGKHVTENGASRVFRAGRDGVAAEVLWGR